MGAWSDLPILQECKDSYPQRPQIDPATTPWPRDQLARKIDYYMDLLSRAAK